jgi:hypothetical protein
MKLLRRARVLIVAVVALACERAKPATSDSVAAVKPVGAAESTTVAATSTWDASAGPLLLVAADAPDRAFVVVPDSASAAGTLSNIPHPASVTLFSRAGSVQTAELPMVADTGACIVASLSAAPPPRPWNVGFIGGVVAPIAMDSTESIASPDSAALVVTMNRLASALPNDPAGRFSGLAFVVRGLWRFNISNGPQVVIGSIMRQINQEATHLQERTFLIIEKPSTDTTFSTVYSERSYGDEETIESRDVLASMSLGANRNTALVVSRDFGDATAYGLLERGDDGRWRRRWVSARRHCGA